MKLRYINIRNFGKLKDKEIFLKDGINLIYGPNESGKSTVHSFIRGMFFGVERYRGRASKNDPYTKFEPWDRPADYGGKLGFTVDEKDFCIERSFYKKDIRQSLVCENDREELSIPQGDLQMLLGGISESVYDNTVSIGQLKSETDHGLVHELENYMSNYADTGAGDVDLSRAEDLLKKKKKFWDNQRKTLKKQWEKKQEQQEQQILYVQNEIQNLEQQLEQAEEKKKNLEQAEKFQEPEDEEKSQEFLRRQQEEEKKNQEEKRKIQQEKEEKRKELLRDRQEDQELARKNDCIWKSILCVAGVIFLIGILGVRKMSGNTGLWIAGLGGILFVGNSLYQMSFRAREKTRRMEREEKFHEEWMELIQREQEFLPGQAVFKEKDILKMTTIPSEDKISRLEGQQDMLRQQVEEKDILLQNLLEGAEEIRQKPEKLKKCETEIESLELAMDIMGKLSQNIRRKIGKQLQNRMEEILGEITQGKYNKISINEKMKITLYEWEKAVPLYQVSRGTVEQVYFALRMAVADVLCQEAMPVILDDVFAMYDEARLVQTLKWLEKRGGQVLIFSCHKREMELVKKLGIQANIIQMEEKIC